MIRSGLNVPTPAIPIPDLAVPYAAPVPKEMRVSARGPDGAPYRRRGGGESQLGYETYSRRSWHSQCRPIHSMTVSAAVQETAPEAPPGSFRAYHADERRELRA